LLVEATQLHALISSVLPTEYHTYLPEAERFLKLSKEKFFPASKLYEDINTYLLEDILYKQRVAVFDAATLFLLLLTNYCKPILTIQNVNISAIQRLKITVELLKIYKKNLCLKNLCLLCSIKY